MNFWIFFFTTTYLRDYPYAFLSNVLKITCFVCMGLFHRLLLCFIVALPVLEITTQFWFLQFWNTVWNQEVWFSQLYSYSRFLWLFIVFSDSVRILGMIFRFLLIISNRIFVQSLGFSNHSGSNQFSYCAVTMPFDSFAF